MLRAVARVNVVGAETFRIGNAALVAAVLGAGLDHVCEVDAVMLGLERGHCIGLHFALNGLTDMQRIREQIAKEMEILDSMFEFKIDTFSIHRPSKDVLREDIKLPGILNAYQDEFFTFAENMTEDTPVKVKYMSDANHIWRYGYPDEKNIMDYNKVQILTHPFAWCKEGYDNFNNYKALIKEKYMELVDSVDHECKDFGEYKDWFMHHFPV